MGVVTPSVSRVIFTPQALRERRDEAVLREPVLSVQHEVHRRSDRHVRRPPGLALQAEPCREGRQQEDHTPPLVLHPQGEYTHTRARSHTHTLCRFFKNLKIAEFLCVFVCDHQDWIEFEEIADLEERAKSLFFEKENEEEVQKSQAAAKEKEFQSVKATKDQVGEVRLCDITAVVILQPIRNVCDQRLTAPFRNTSASFSLVEGRNPVTGSKCYSDDILTEHLSVYSYLLNKVQHAA